MNKLVSSFTNWKLSVLLIALVVFLSYWQMLLLNVWQDDNALIFKVQHFNEAAGVFGLGPAGSGAYRYIALPYIPLHQFLGDNLIADYALCLLLYFLAALSIYILARTILGSKVTAAFSAMFFAAGFIGLEGTTRLFNSIQTSYSIALASLTFTLLYIAFQKGFAWSYALAVLFFYYTIETGYVRTQYIILPIVVFFILHVLQKQKITEKLKNIIFLAPFLYIYYYQYFSSPDPRSSSIKEMFVNLISGKWEYLYGLFGSVGNIFFNPYLSHILFSLAGKITATSSRQVFLLEFGIVFAISIIVWKLKVKKYFLLIPASGLWLVLQRSIFYKSELISTSDVNTLFAAFIGGEVILILLFYLLTLKEREKMVLGLFFLSWIISNALAYSFYLPLNPLETTNRYLTHSLAPLALLVGTIFLLNTKNKEDISVLKKRNLMLVILFIFVNIFSTNKFLYDFRSNVSIPTENFYKALKSYVPSFNKGAIFYFDVDNDSIARQQFRDFFSVGSMPDSTAIATRYGVDRYDFFLTESLNEVQEKVSQEKVDINNIYTFFYKRGRLIDTTNIFRDESKRAFGKGVSLNSQNSQSFSNLNKNDSGTKVITSPLSYTNLNFPSVLPFKVVIEGIVQAIDLESLRFPISDESKKVSVTQYPLEDKIAAIQIFQQLNAFRKTARVEDLPSERSTSTGYLIDGDMDTYWRYNRGLWDKKKGVSVVFDLGSVKPVNQIRWVNVYSNSTPISYNFESSNDKVSWRVIEDVKRAGKLPGQEVIEKIENTRARYFRFNVWDTFDNDSPVISEVSFIDSNNTRLIEVEVREFNYLPYSLVNSIDDAKKMELALNQDIIVPVFWVTDKDSDWNEVARKNIIVKNNNYFREEITIPGGGTRLTGIRIGPVSVPSTLKINRISFETK